MNTGPRADMISLFGFTGAAAAAASRAPAVLARMAVPTTVCFTNSLLLISFPILILSSFDRPTKNYSLTHVPSIQIDGELEHHGYTRGERERGQPADAMRRVQRKALELLPK